MNANPSITVVSKALTIVSNINEQHRLACRHAEDAVQHAIECGKLLMEEKAKLLHGEFGNWIAKNCEFSQATANNYMKVAKNPTALGNSHSIRHLFPSGREPAKKRVAPIRTDVEVNAGEHPPEPVSANDMTIETALKILKPVYKHHYLVSAVRGHKNKIGKLRNKLKKAESELAAAEAAAIAAAMELEHTPKMHT